jgi:outer membrane protein TolC
MLKTKLTPMLFFVVIFFTENCFALSLPEYLEQVRNQNLGYAAANESAEGYELLKKKADLVTAINLFATTQTGFTDQNQALQIVRYTNVYNRNSQVGFTQTADFGLSTKLYYSLNHVTYKNLSTSSPNPALASNNYQSIPTLELSLPLWQNRLGASTRASKDSTFFSNESQKLAAKSISVSSLVIAEKSYWALVATRKIVEIQKNSLKSAEQILNYVSKKEKMNLGEKGDVLQARALVETKKLLLQQAQNDEKLAARNFNKQRYIIADIVSEPLDDINHAKLKNLLVPKIRAGHRLDTKSSEAGMKAAIAAAKVEEENNKPALSLYGSYSVNQIEKNKSSAISNSLYHEGAAGTLGLKLSVPINFGLTSDIRAGALKTASAAKLNYRQKLFEQETDWENLIFNLTSYKENLKLAQMIEVAQKSKLENERKLLKQGRTSTYQILLFEQDYSNSQLTTIQIANQLLGLIAEEKLYQN